MTMDPYATASSLAAICKIASEICKTASEICKTVSALRKTASTLSDLQSTIEELHQQLGALSNVNDRKTCIRGRYDDHNNIPICLPDDGCAGPSKGSAVPCEMLKTFPDIEIGFAISTEECFNAHTNHKTRVGDVIIAQLPLQEMRNQIDEADKKTVMRKIDIFFREPAYLHESIPTLNGWTLEDGENSILSTAMGSEEISMPLQHNGTSTEEEALEVADNFLLRECLNNSGGTGVMRDDNRAPVSSHIFANESRRSHSWENAMKTGRSAKVTKGVRLHECPYCDNRHHTRMEHMRRHIQVVHSSSCVPFASEMSKFNTKPRDENRPYHKSGSEVHPFDQKCEFQAMPFYVGPDFNQGIRSQCSPTPKTVDLLKLGTSYALSAGIFLLSSSGWLQDPLFLSIVMPGDQHLGYNTYLLALTPALVVGFWTNLYSLLLQSSVKQQRLRYVLWAYGFTFVVGSNLGFDHGMLAVVGLPIIMNVALSCSFLEEMFLKSVSLL